MILSVYTSDIHTTKTESGLTLYLDYDQIYTLFSRPRRRQLKINQVWKLLFRHDRCKYSFTTGHWLNFVAILAQQYYYNMPDTFISVWILHWCSLEWTVNIMCSHFFLLKTKKSDSMKNDVASRKTKYWKPISIIKSGWYFWENGVYCINIMYL